MRFLTLANTVYSPIQWFRAKNEFSSLPKVDKAIECFKLRISRQNPGDVIIRKIHVNWPKDGATRFEIKRVKLHFFKIVF